MQLTSDLKRKIDNLSYEDMLRKHRFEPIDSDFFIGETGDYFYLKFNRLKKKITEAEKVRVSKKVGWDNDT